MKRFINLKREVVWVENFTRFDPFVIVNYRGKKYKCTKNIFGTKLFPIDEATKKYLKNTLNIDVDIPSFIQTNKNTSCNQTRSTVKESSFYISPNGTCLSKMDWDFD